MRASQAWMLEEYDWDPETGLATFVYERRSPTTREIEQMVTVRAQPYDPKHEGWNTQSRMNVYQAF